MSFAAEYMTGFSANIIRVVSAIAHTLRVVSNKWISSFCFENICKFIILGMKIANCSKEKSESVC